jgi:hypothetical protein
MTTVAWTHRRLKTAHSLASPACFLLHPGCNLAAAQSPTLNLFFLAGIAGAAPFLVCCVTMESARFPGWRERAEGLTARFICRSRLAAHPLPMGRPRTHHPCTRCKRSRSCRVARPRHQVEHPSGLYGERETRTPKRPFQARLSHATPSRRADLHRRRQRAATERFRCSVRPGAAKKGTVPRSSPSDVLRYSPHFRRSCPGRRDLGLPARWSAKTSGCPVSQRGMRTRGRRWPWRSCPGGALFSPGPCNRAPALARLH